jgi:DUF4097 and DUF4098 domain-containing protein YvlB
MQKTFHTPGPADLYVELGTGDLHVRCADVTETTVDVDGKDAEDVLVEERGDQIVVIAPNKRTAFMLGFSSSSQQLRVRVTMPHASKLATKLGSADLDAAGRLGETMVRSGSGDVRLEEVDGGAVIETGSGDVEIEAVRGPLRLKSGSGDIEIGQLDDEATISTGSGDVEIGTAARPVQVKSGSGDLRVREAADALSLSTASGDLLVDRIRRGGLRAHNVSGDIRVGIPAGVPVWTDISTVTGSVASDLEGAGQPTEGQDYIELRAKTVSGDVILEQL